MSAHEKLWRTVKQSLPEIGGNDLLEMTRFLATLDCPHANLLRGLPIGGKLDEDSARHLEQSICEHARKKQVSRNVAAQWLRWIHLALKILETASTTPITPTKLAVLPRPPSSPFSREQTELCRPVLKWNHGLESWLASLRDKELSSAQWTAGVVLSSVLIGGLLEAAKVKEMLHQLAGDLPVVHQRPYVEFNQRMGKFGDAHCQRWFLDPITELLYLRRSGKHTTLSADQLTKAIQALLCAHGTPKGEHPKGLNKLIKHATAHWHQRAASVDIAVMQRKVQSHALHTRAWNRLFRKQDAYGLPAPQTDVGDTPLTDDEFQTDFCLLYPWFPVVSKALDLPPRTQPKSVDVIHAVATARISLLASHSPYVNWIAGLLQGQNATNDRLAVSTIKRIGDAVIPQVLSRLGERSPADLTDADLVELYEEIVHGAQGSQRKILAKGLREFHWHLVKAHAKFPLKSQRETLGEDAGLEPVDANPLSFEEYYKAKKFLERQIAQGGDRELNRIAKLVMMLAFRTGMRRREIFGLRLMDVPSTKHLELIIRPHEERRLKTKSSQRIIPARLLLPLDERRDFQAWLQRRMAAADISDDKARVFDVPQTQGGWARVSEETTSDRIIKALIHAAGEKAKIHQLRHSFATWLYLSLRSSDYPEVLTLFDELPDTCAFLKRGARLRQVLLNHPGQTSRTYGYVVARLLGHSSPLVSLTSYIHSTEFIHRAFAIRKANELSSDAVKGAANLKPAWGNRLFEKGVEHLLEHVRKQHSRVNAATTPAVSPSPEGAGALASTSIKGRPRKTAPVGWIPLVDVRTLLHLYSSTDDAIENICIQIGFTVEQGNRIVDEVRKSGESYGFEIRGKRPLAFPQFARKNDEKNWEEDLERHLQRAFALDPQAACAGALIHLQHYNPSKRDVVFRGATQKANLTKYLRLLDLMEVGAKNVLVLLRNTGEQQIPYWAKKSLGRLGGTPVRCIAPPVPVKASSYSDWVGLQLIDSHGSAWSGVSRGSMFLALIASSGVAQNSLS